jgi:tRNA(fMet)-specific endonuclease VapC
MYVLDTNTLSELVKRQPNEGLIRQIRQQSPERLFTTSICVMELRYGACLRSDRDVFWQRVQREILSRVQILGFGPREALIAGDLLAHLKQIGRPIGLGDTFIGAVARSHGYIVVTHNLKHFQSLPHVKAEDWFSSLAS